MSGADTELVEGTVQIDGQELELSNLDKVLYPEYSVIDGLATLLWAANLASPTSRCIRCWRWSPPTCPPQN